MHINLTNLARHDNTFVIELLEFNNIRKELNERATDDAVGTFNINVNGVPYLRNIINDERNNTKMKELCNSIYGISGVANPLESITLYASNTTVINDDEVAVYNPTQVNVRVDIYTTAHTLYITENFIFDVISHEKVPEPTSYYKCITYSTYLNTKDTVLIKVDKVNLTSLSVAGSLCLSLNDLDMFRRIQISAKMINKIQELNRFMEGEFTTIPEYKVNTLFKATKELKAELAADGHEHKVTGILEIIPKDEDDAVYTNFVKKFEFDLID